MKNNFKGIIFDLDGTLVDSEVVWHMAESRLLEARGYVYTLKERALVLGLRIDEGLEALRKHYGMPEPLDVLIDELNRTMAGLVEDYVVEQPGAQALIDWVVARNMPHAIASASSQIVIDAIVEHMGWLPHFPVRCSADDEARGKPAPDVYLTAARKIGVAPQDCLAIEDTPHGARAAVAAHMTVFVVPDLKYSTPERFTGITPYVFQSLEDVLALLRGQ
jgi:beta-phosphoglucomutase-like phosphatase (HAD superfamily)